MKSVLIIGMGKLGSSLAYAMQERGNDVMVVDVERKPIDDISPDFENALIGDCTNEDVVKSLAVDSFDICFVCIGENEYAALVVTSLLNEHGAKRIIANASSDRHGVFLRNSGADEIVFPEKQYAEHLAVRYSADNVLDFIDMNEDYSMYEIAVPQKWIGHTMKELHIREKYDVTVIALKGPEGTVISPSADRMFGETDHVSIVGRKEDLARINNGN